MKTFADAGCSARSVLCVGILVVVALFIQMDFWSVGPATALAGEAWDIVVDEKPPGLIEDPDDDGPSFDTPCEYNDIQGVAEIISIGPAPADRRRCKNAVLVLYNFIPDDPTAPERFLYKRWPTKKLRFFLGSGENPPMAWIEKKGLLKGTRHRCERGERKTGACTPVVYRFPEIDTTDWGKDCYGR